MIDIILCSRPPICCYAKSKGMLVGARSDHSQQLSCCKPEFIDFNFHKPNVRRHLAVVKEMRPKYCVAPDVLDAADLPKVLDIAEQLSEYASNVIVVPHVSGLVYKIPGEYIIGYSVPTSYGAAEIFLWELQGRRVHLLGGTPRRQYELRLYIPGVVSIDGNAYIKAAQFGEYVGADLKFKKDCKYKGIDMIDLVKKSIDNITCFWREEAKLGNA